MPRILVVDDQAHVRGALTIALQAKGFETVAVEDAVSALQEFETEKFDLAVVDIYMPDVDGVKLIKVLRERSPDLPIIAMSGVMLNQSQQNVVEYLPQLPSLKKIVCLKKPFRSGELSQAISSALAVPA